MPSRLIDMGRILFLLLIQLRIKLKQLRKAHDGIQGRAQFMRHGGQEL